MISGTGDIATAVKAMKHGAFDIVEKPFCGSDVVSRLKDAISSRPPMRRGEPVDFPDREHLTSRERETLQRSIFGASSKEISK